MSEASVGWRNKLFAIRPFSMVAFAFLAFMGLKEGFYAISTSNPTPLTCSDIESSPNAKWVQLEGCELRYPLSTHAYFEGLKSLKTPVIAWVPVYAVGAPEDAKALFVIASSDDDILGDVKEMEKYLQLAESADPQLLAAQNISKIRPMTIEGWLEPIPKAGSEEPDWSGAMASAISPKTLLIRHDVKPESIWVVFGMLFASFVFGWRAFGRLRAPKRLEAEEFSLLERVFFWFLDLLGGDYSKSTAGSLNYEGPLVRIENVSKRFVKGGAVIRVLQGASLNIDKGDRVAIVGQSGSGKSTFLHILGALDKPNQGQIWIKDQPLFIDMDIAPPADFEIGEGDYTQAQWAHVGKSWRALIAPWLRAAMPSSPKSGDIAAQRSYVEEVKTLVSRSRPWYMMTTPFRAPWGGLRRLASVLFSKRVRIDSIRNKEVGFVFQFHHLLPDQSALRNVMMPMLVAGAPIRDATVRAKALLEKVGLNQRMSHRPGELSGGEQQRVAIARALVFDPTLLLADEPTGNLDPDTADEIMSLLLELNEDLGAALVMVTHDHDLARRCPRQYTLKGGQFVSGVNR